MHPITFIFTIEYSTGYENKIGMEMWNQSDGRKAISSEISLPVLCISISLVAIKTWHAYKCIIDEDWPDLDLFPQYGSGKMEPRIKS
jgi:hypothetical protein